MPARKPYRRSLDDSQVAWDNDFDFESPFWDTPIIGRKVVLHDGERRNIIGFNMGRRHETEEEATTDSGQVRFLVRAEGYACRVIIKTSVDDEEIIYTLPVARDSTQSVSLIADRFEVIGEHVGRKAGAPEPDCILHFRADARATLASTWIDTRAYQGTGAETLIIIPAFAHEFEVLRVETDAAVVLRYYDADTAGNKILEQTVALPHSDRFFVNTRGYTTIQAVNGQNYGIAWRCHG